MNPLQLDQVATAEPFGHIEAPEDSDFPTAEAAVHAATQSALRNGYGISKRRSVVNRRNEIRRIDVVCDRSRRFVEQGCGERETATRLVDCPFFIKIRRQPAEGNWRLEVVNPEHNHGRSHHPVIHSCHRKRPAEADNDIELLSQLPPREVASKIRENHPGVLIRPKDVANKRVKLREERLGGRTPTQVLLSEFQDAALTGVFFRFEPAEGPLERLFFCFPESRALFQRFPDLLLIDSTYKTNRFNLPLMHVVGTTCLEHTFTVAFCFLSKEDGASYQWAIGCLKEALGGSHGTSKLTCVVTDQELALKNALSFHFPLTPQITCGWHINKNVLCQVQKVWGHKVVEMPEESEAVERTRKKFLDAWHAVVHAKTFAQFQAKWDDLKTNHAVQVNLIGYLERQWMPWKHQWAECIVDHTRHFGNRNTSRLEGAHSRLKSYLAASTHDFLSCVDRIRRLIGDENAKIDAEISSAMATALKHLRREKCFSGVISKVAPTALRKSLAEIEKAKRAHKRREDLETCTGTLEGSMGVPCAHTILRRLEQHGGNLSPLDMHDFDAHWWLENRGISPSRPETQLFEGVLEPQVIQRGRGPARVEQIELHSTESQRV